MFTFTSSGNKKLIIELESLDSYIPGKTYPKVDQPIYFMSSIPTISS